MSGLASEISTVQFTLVEHASSIGWQVVSDTNALTKRRGASGLFFYDDLESKLIELNPGVVTQDNAASIIQKLESIPNTIEGNREILEWLRGSRSIYHNEERRQRNVTLIDFKDPSRNLYQVTYEWKYKSGTKKGNRADVVFLINGIPVAIIENKNPKLPDAMERAIKQLRRYQLETPEMLLAPQVFNITHLIEYFYGVTWNYTRKFIFNWKSEREESYRQAVQSFFDRRCFLQMLENWILFFVKDDELQKTILRQHQTRAATKVVARCADPNKKSGLIWHTQGSGKTFTLITAAKLILEDKERFSGATVMLVVDRNELEGQLSGWVEALVGEMQATDIKIEKAYTKARLQELLDQDFRGLIISMIHKFDGINKDSCTRSDFFVLIDEAHRSTGGDLGNYLMGALPNATLIGFTGTPIDKTEYGQGTFKVFGKEDDKGYLDKYSIKESIEDGTTLKLRHALAPSSITLPEEILEKEFLSLKETEGISDIDELNRILDRAIKLKTFLKSDEIVEKTAQFVAKHFKENVAPLGYKAFFVAVDREACALYKQALDKYLPPESVVPIYTKNAADTIDRPLVAKLQVSEDEEKKVRKLFPKPEEQPQILIVTDKLLTGYDAPILYCMYLQKPMRDHVLLQAVARVNRPYEDDSGVKKPCGLIIDFVGILRELNKALAFDSDEVNGVIEDLDLLLAQFKHLMSTRAQEYLKAGFGGKDEQLERLLYERFLDKQERQTFIELYKEIETLYEILSPSPELRDYITDYNRLADLYVMLCNAYGQKTTFYGDIAHKTEMLVRETAQVYGLDKLTKPVEFDADALEALKQSKGSDNAKVINLVKSLQFSADQHGEKEPYLIPIAERAQNILQAFEDRQVSTQEALAQIEALMREKLQAEEERKKTGLDTNTFTIFWLLRQQKFEQPEQLSKEINDTFIRFPNYGTNSDEMRQLKAEIYKTLLKVISGKEMVDLTEKILRLKRQ